MAVRIPPSSYEFIPIGQRAQGAKPGDFILVHRKGVFSRLIQFGEWIRFRFGYWTHAAYVETSETLIEALWPRVKRTPLADYDGVDYVLVRTNLALADADQATAFVVGCVGERYGVVDDIGIGMRFATPGRGLWFGVNGSKICSGLVALAELRGWATFSIEACSMSPTELALAYDVPPRSKSLR